MFTHSSPHFDFAFSDSDYPMSPVDYGVSTD